jgi:hypothetical protein
MKKLNYLLILSVFLLVLTLPNIAFAQSAEAVYCCYVEPEFTPDGVCEEGVQAAASKELCPYNMGFAITITGQISNGPNSNILVTFANISANTYQTISNSSGGYSIVIPHTLNYTITATSENATHTCLYEHRTFFDSDSTHNIALSCSLKPVLPSRPGEQCSVDIPCEGSLTCENGICVSQPSPLTCTSPYPGDTSYECVGFNLVRTTTNYICQDANWAPLSPSITSQFCSFGCNPEGSCLPQPITEGCTNDDQCPLGLVCVENQCVPPEPEVDCPLINIQPGQCLVRVDGSVDFGGATCESFGYDGGELNCVGTCGFVNNCFNCPDEVNECTSQMCGVGCDVCDSSPVCQTQTQCQPSDITLSATRLNNQKGFNLSWQVATTCVLTNNFRLESTTESYNFGISLNSNERQYTDIISDSIEADEDGQFCYNISTNVGDITLSARTCAAPTNPICYNRAQGEQFCSPEGVVTCINGQQTTEECINGLCLEAQTGGVAPQCVDSGVCTKCGGVFGLFTWVNYVNSDCPLLYANGICYPEDQTRSLSVVAEPKECALVSSCYNYLTQDTCENNACSLEITENCEWKSLGGNTGVGICRPQNIEDQDCTVCAENPLGCSPDMCQAYSDDGCFSNEIPSNHPNTGYGLNSNVCINENQVSCESFLTRTDCVGEDGTNFKINITYDTTSARNPIGGTHEILSNSNNAISGKCVWLDIQGLTATEGGVCVRDANSMHLAQRSNNVADRIADCANNKDDIRCLTDFENPNTTLKIITNSTLYPANVLTLTNSNYYSLPQLQTLSTVVTDNMYTSSEIQTLFDINFDSVQGQYPRLDLLGAKDRIRTQFNNIASQDLTITYFSKDPSNNLEVIRSNTIKTLPGLNINYTITTTPALIEEVNTYATNITLTLKNQNLFEGYENWDVLCDVTLQNTNPQAQQYTRIAKLMNTNDLVFTYQKIPDGAYYFNISCKDNHLQTENFQTETIQLNNDLTLYGQLPVSGLRNSGENIWIYINTSSEGICYYTLNQSYIAPIQSPPINRLLYPLSRQTGAYYEYLISAGWTRYNVTSGITHSAILPNLPQGDYEVYTRCDFGTDKYFGSNQHAQTFAIDTQGPNLLVINRDTNRNYSGEIINNVLRLEFVCQDQPNNQTNFGCRNTLFCIGENSCTPNTLLGQLNKFPNLTAPSDPNNIRIINATLSDEGGNQHNMVLPFNIINTEFEPPMITLCSENTNCESLTLPTPTITNNETQITYVVNAGTFNTRIQTLIVDYQSNNIIPQIKLIDSLKEGELAFTPQRTLNSYQGSTNLLSNSNYQFIVNTVNSWGINQTIKINFRVDAPAMQINITNPTHSLVENPKFAVSTSHILENLTIQTSLPSTCGFVYNEPVLSTLPSVFDNMFSENMFSTENNQTHKINVDLRNFANPTIFDNGPLRYMWIVCKPLILGEPYGFETIQVGYVSSPSQIELNANPNPVLDANKRESILKANTNQQTVCFLEQTEGKVTTTRFDKLNSFNRINIISSVNFTKDHERTTLFTNAVLNNFETYDFNITCVNLANVNSSNQITINTNLTNNPNPIIIKPSMPYYFSSQVELEVSTQIDDVCKYTLNDSIQPNIILTGDGKNHTALLTLEDGIHNLSVLCQRAPNTLLKQTFIVDTGEFKVRVQTPRVPLSVEPFNYAYGSEDEFLLNLSLNRPATCAYGYNANIGASTSKEQLQTLYNSWPKLSQQNNNFSAYKQDFNVRSINASYTGIGSEYSYQLMQLICLHEENLFYRTINVGSDKTNPNITQLEIIPAKFEDELGIKSQITAKTDVRTICEVTTDTNGVNIIHPDASSTDAFQLNHGFEVEYYGDISEFEEIEFNVTCYSRANRSTSKLISVEVDLKDQNVSIEQPSTRIRSQIVPIKATTIHPDTCTYELTGESLPSPITNQLQTEQQGRSHTAQITLEEGTYYLQINCGRANSEKLEFEVILSQPEIWVVKPSGLGQRPTYAHGFEEVYEIELQTSRNAECKYSMVQGLNPRTKGLDISYEEDVTELNQLSQTRFNLTLNLSSYFQGYSYNGLERTMHVICKETDTSLEEDVYFYEPIKVASTITPPLLTQVSITPIPVKDPANRFADLYIVTNQPAICFIQTLSDDKTPTYKPINKQHFTSYNNFTTIRTERINFPSPIVTTYEYEFNLTCENRAGLRTSQNVTIPLEITTDSAPKIIHPSRFVANQPVPIVVETQIADSCTYTIQTGNNISLDKQLVTQNNLIHTGSEQLAEGDHTIHVLCKSRGAPVSKQFTVDRKGPSNVNVTNHEYTCSLRDFEVNFDAEDNISGIAAYEYIVKIPGREDFNETTTNTRAIIDVREEDENKTLELRVTAINNAGIRGNTTVKNIKITTSDLLQCDVEPPRAFISERYNQTTNSYEVRVDCVDNVACRPSFRYSIHTNLSQDCTYAQSSPLNATIIIDQTANFCYEVIDTNDNKDSRQKRYTIRLPTQTQSQCYNSAGIQTVCGGNCPTCIIGSQCTNNNQCQSGLCQSGLCSSNTTQNQATTNTCDLNSDCEQGTLCLSGSCRPQEEASLRDTTIIPRDFASQTQPKSSTLSMILLVLGLLLIVIGGGLIYYDDYIKRHNDKTRKPNQTNRFDPRRSSGSTVIEIPNPFSVKTPEPQDDPKEHTVRSKEEVERLKKELVDIKSKKKITERKKLFDEFDDSPKLKPKPVIKKTKPVVKQKAPLKKQTKEEEEDVLSELRKIAEDKDV